MNRVIVSACALIAAGCSSGVVLADSEGAEEGHTAGVDIGDGSGDGAGSDEFNGVWAGGLALFVPEYDWWVCEGEGEIEIVDGIAEGFGLCEMGWGGGGWDDEPIPMYLDGEVIDGELDGEISFEVDLGGDWGGGRGGADGGPDEFTARGLTEMGQARFLIRFQTVVDAGWESVQVEGEWGGQRQ